MRNHLELENTSGGSNHTWTYSPVKRCRPVTSPRDTTANKHHKRYNVNKSNLFQGGIYIRNNNNNKRSVCVEEINTHLHTGLLSALRTESTPKTLCAPPGWCTARSGISLYISLKIPPRNPQERRPCRARRAAWCWGTFPHSSCGETTQRLGGGGGGGAAAAAAARSFSAAPAPSCPGFNSLPHRGQPTEICGDVLFTPALLLCFNTESLFIELFSTEWLWERRSRSLSLPRCCGPVAG